MNQVTNKIPYGLLTKEEQEQFCTEAKARGMYGVFTTEGKWELIKGSTFQPSLTYRLIIKDDEWYYIERHIFDEGEFIHGSNIGSLECCVLARPATTEEIEAAKPKELTLEEKIKAKYPDYYVEMLEWSLIDILNCKGHIHASAQSMKGFQGYVYYAHPFTVKPMPVMTEAGKCIQPVAVLFERGK